MSKGGSLNFYGVCEIRSARFMLHHIQSTTQLLKEPKRINSTMIKNIKILKKWGVVIFFVQVLIDILPVLFDSEFSFPSAVVSFVGIAFFSFSLSFL